MVDSVDTPIDADLFGTNIISDANDEIINYVAYLGGYNNISGRTIIGVQIYCKDYHERQVRIALYAGGSAADPSNAILIKDFGVTTGATIDQLITINLDSNDYINLPVDTYIWLGIKSDYPNSEQFFQTVTTNSPANTGSFQNARGMYVETTSSKDPYVSWGATIPSGGSFQDTWFYGQIILQSLSATDTSLVVNNSTQVQSIGSILLTLPNQLIINDSDQVQNTDTADVFDPAALRVANTEQTQPSDAVSLASLSTFLSVSNSQQRHLDEHITMVNARGKLRITVEIIV